MDTRRMVADEVLHTVRKNGGIKTKDLVEQIGSKFRNDPNRPNSFVVTEIVNDLISDKRIVEIEYSIDMTDVQSFLLPAKTSVNIRGQESVPHRI